MKIRLKISKAHYDSVRQELETAGIGIDDEAPYVLTEAGSSGIFLAVRTADGERIRLPAQEIIFVESYGHSVDVHAKSGVYASSDPLYKLAAELDPEKFLRISNSVIVARKHVKKIRPSLSMKFVLTLSDGTLVDVTRSYYGAFREFFNI
ncbi:MAG: LytTR family transcriptional regulator [Lachnospiraceae bacterium]|nr:LytTR family transcriptional regulator [Lachnospiraceae bacterium]MBQ6196908.1 LytTR family transcriptional regulator [Lachnospiraceae bacterium]